MSELIETEVLSLAEQAREFAVTTHEQADAAGAFLRDVKGLRRKVTDTFGPLKQAASDAHKKIVAEEKRHLDPLDRAEAEIKTRIGAFAEGERRKREAEERKARAEAERVESERRAAEERDRRAVEDARLAEAARLEAAGRKEEAERVIAAPLPPPAPRPPPPPVVALPPPRPIAGASVRETFRAQVYSVVELAAHVAATPTDANLIIANLPELNRRAQGVRKAGAMVVPGVTCIAERNVASR